MESFDYVIIGAGSAGCILADRLSACGRHSVAVLEAGGRNRGWATRLPIGYGASFYNPRVNWCLHAEPDPAMDDRSMYFPRGKGLGGSSAINGLVYCRGLPVDYDDWRAAGNPGWGWDDVVPIFDALERRISADGAETAMAGLAISDRQADLHPLRRHFLAAAAEAGLPAAAEGSVRWALGVGAYEITTRAGLRCSAADAFLRPALARRNLTVRTGVHVRRVVMEGGRATGVEIAGPDGARRIAARGEVILAAGAVHSPQILQLSGLGPGARLSDLGIAVARDMPGVGSGLQDHLGVDYLLRAKEPTLNQVLGRLSGQIGAALRYAWDRRGPLSLSVNQMGGMVSAGPEEGAPALQLYFNPLSYTTVEVGRRRLMKPDPWPGFAIGYNACRPTSRGSVELASPDPATAPRIRPNYLSTNDDIASAVAGARLVGRLLATRALKGLIDGAPVLDPGAADEATLLADFRARATSVYHACSTCRMAPEAEGGVVDRACRVYGVDGLRVADASIFPNITSANTNAPALLVGAKAAKMILAAREDA